MTSETKERIHHILTMYTFYCNENFTNYEEQCYVYEFDGNKYTIFKLAKPRIDDIIERLARLDDLME